jgi:hypothetical protein
MKPTIRIRDPSFTWKRFKQFWLLRTNHSFVFHYDISMYYEALRYFANARSTGVNPLLNLLFQQLPELCYNVQFQAFSCHIVIRLRGQLLPLRNMKRLCY